MKKVLKTFIIILLIVAIIIGICGYIFIKNKLNKINFEELDLSDLSLNGNIVNDINSIEGISMTEDEYNNIKTIAIFGSDSRNIEDTYDNGRSDCIMIATINQNSKSISIISIPRDTYVNVPGYGKTKINHAFSYGKEQLAIKTINENFGLDIQEYVTVSWEAVVTIVNMIGGIDIEISEAEMEFINGRVDSLNKDLNENSEKLTSYGKTHLDGVQSLAHCSNRYVGNNDFARTERQRIVLTAILEKVSNENIIKINNIIDEFLPYIKTNIDISEYLLMIPEFLESKNEYLSNVISAQVPSVDKATGQYIDGIYYFVPNDYEECKEDLIKYLYKD